MSNHKCKEKSHNKNRTASVRCKKQDVEGRSWAAEGETKGPGKMQSRYEISLAQPAFEHGPRNSKTHTKLDQGLRSRLLRGKVDSTYPLQSSHSLPKLTCARHHWPKTSLMENPGASRLREDYPNIGPQ